jgi:hypothetical protein
MKIHDTTSSPGYVHPMPLTYYIDLNIASRATLWRWRQQGLKILKVGGRAYLAPSELTRFMEAKHEEAANETVE